MIVRLHFILNNLSVLLFRFVFLESPVLSSLFILAMTLLVLSFERKKFAEECIILRNLTH